MTTQVLSQDEVDTLLQGVPAEVGEADPGGVHPYDLAAQEGIVRARLHALDLVHARFIKMLRNGFVEFLRRTTQVTAAPVRVLKFEELAAELGSSSNLNVAQVKPLHGSALVAFDSVLVSLVVDTLFGGKGAPRSASEGRDFSRTEYRIIQRTLAVVLDSYHRSWFDLYPLKLEYLRTESNARGAAIARPSEIVVVETFNVDFGTGIGAIRICMPYSTLEPIRDRLERPQTGVAFVPDPQWEQALSDQIRSTDVVLTADLASMQITIGDLLHIEVGDVLSVDIPPVISASIDGVRMFECSYGALNGQYAVRIDRVLPRPERCLAGA